MENKKKAYYNTESTPNNETQTNKTVFNHQLHQHTNTLHHPQLLQQGLKIPQHQHAQYNHLTNHQHHLTHLIPQHQHMVHGTVRQNQFVLQFPHQHPQKFQNHNHNYHYQSINQPTYHSHNLSQNNGVKYVSHQTQEHFHSQSQESIKPEQPVKLSIVPTHSPKVKDIDRKKNNVTQQLRSPFARRPIEAPVKLQGWLHKQGSDGLMLWKRRWFVLSEYCLFYYKGSEEEKVLGSILLPSYTVSICEPNDKVSRKFAFKCEHTNMRTYILAADSHELMVQWVNALSMACLLQSSKQSKPAINQAASKIETSISEIQQQNQPIYVRSTPIHAHTSSNTTDLSNLSQQELGLYLQPLYANAPPKPRRLTDGYISPSSEIIDRNSNDSKFAAGQKLYHYNVKPAYIPYDRVNSPLNMSPNVQGYRLEAQQPYQQNCEKHLHTPEYNIPKERQTLERRTPDTYGRSKLNASKGSSFSDYEDVYMEQYKYKRPLSPLSYSKSKLSSNLSSSVLRRHPPLGVYGTKESGLSLTGTIKKVPNSIQRPHSADFLDYEVKHQNLQAMSKQPRPKSSLDINRTPSNDNYFYSEEHYAQKMRNSAQYLPNMCKYSNAQPEYVLSSRNKWPSAHEPQHANNSSTSLHNYVPARSRSVLSNGSFIKELERDTHNKTLDSLNNEHQNYVLRNKQDLVHGYEDNIITSRDYDSFTRSASARLYQAGSQIDSRPYEDGGERKREESMKRLLEWKQRMLQSPLNRKTKSGINKSCYNKYNSYYGVGENGYSVTPTSDIYTESSKFKPAAQYNSYSSDDEASGSISIAMRDTIPRAEKIWTPSLRSVHSKSSTNIANGYENSISHPQQGHISQGPSQQDLSSDTSQSSNSYRAGCPFGNRMNVSAGELLGRTHEELILLLIQLRRQNANICNAIEACYNEIENIQAWIPKMDATKRLENLHKLEQIKQHLLELEKQYEKGKPLVNLVDNMVKLGSLYRFPNSQKNNMFIKDRLEFNQQIQERRLIADEKRDWGRLNPNHSLLQTKVQQLYQLDRLIQEESQILRGLQQDKEEIEKALSGLRQMLLKGFKNPAEIEQARKQQIVLENELSRVHYMLSQNSRKLEETVAGNARLEQELLVLKQKLQLTKQERSSPQISNAGDSLPCVIGTSAMLESDLHTVQQKVGNLQRQRQELSMQVKQLTDRSNNLQQLRALSTNLLGFPQQNKKKPITSWRETDLDNMNSIEYGGSLESLVTPPIALSPLYINTHVKSNQEGDNLNWEYKSSDSASDDTLYNQVALPPEKQEIKTVRIVKRESERRQRDREKTTFGKWDAGIGEEDLFCDVPKNTVDTNGAITVLECDKSSKEISSTHNPISQQSYSLKIPLDSQNAELSPIFKSEAAKEIMNEMSTKIATKHTNRRAVPKEKRRHYTTPNNNLIMKSLSQLPIHDKEFDRFDINAGRARDDLDMERALRQQIDAPDVVRSTLSNKELKYNENTIDNILGTPNKIFIPERYVPEQLPQLSAEEQQHRLRKVESIKKMLSDTTIISGSTANLATDADSDMQSCASVSKNASKVLEEKKQREHLLQLNQILAKQVMEMSKIVAGSNNAEE